MRYLVSAIVVTLLTTAVSCSGSDGDASKGFTGLAARFSPEQPAPGGNTVSMSESSRSGDLVVVAVNVTGTQNVYAALIEVTYDTAVVEFVGWDEGSVLDPGDPYFVTEEAGLVRVDASRLGGQGVDVVGSAPMIYLTFKAMEADTSTLAFQNAQLFDDQPPPQPIPGLSWFGGTVIAD